MAVASIAVSLKEPDWFVFLRAACAVAEGAAVLHVDASTKRRHTRSAADASACVSAILGDPHGRVAVLGGRVGLPRSLGSDFGGFVTRFLGGFRGLHVRTIAALQIQPYGGLAVSLDGATLLVADTLGRTRALHLFSAHTGAFLRRIGDYGNGRLQFSEPNQIWVASDGFVFVADAGNNRIQVLTPQLTFHSFVGANYLRGPTGVCANDAVVVASESVRHRICVFDRGDGALLRRFGSQGCGDAQLYYPSGVCLVSGNREIAVLDAENARVSVWTLDGKFARHVGDGELDCPRGIACSGANELVIADNDRVVVFNAAGETLTTVGRGSGLYSVAIHDSTIYAQTLDDDRCLVFS